MRMFCCLNFENSEVFFYVFLNTQYVYYKQLGLPEHIGAHHCKSCTTTSGAACSSSVHANGDC